MIPLALALAGGAGALAVGLKLFSDRTARKAEASVPRDGRLVEVDGTRLHVFEKGSGPGILMIHGLGGQMRNFARSGVDDLATDHRVVLVDRPGSGYSERPKGASVSLAEQARTIASLIDQLELDRPLVVGHSLGGALALTLALDHPAKVGGLALVAPLTQAQDDVPEPMKGLAIRSETMRRAVANTLAVPMGVATQEKVLAGIFAPEPVPADFATQGGGALALRPGNFYNASSDLVAVEAHMPALVERYAALDVPIDILYGRGDAILDYRIHGERTAEQIQGARIEVVEGGHMIPFTQPEVTARWIRAADARREGRGG